MLNRCGEKLVKFFFLKVLNKFIMKIEFFKINFLLFVFIWVNKYISIVLVIRLRIREIKN